VKIRSRTRNYEIEIAKVVGFLSLERLCHGEKVQALAFQDGTLHFSFGLVNHVWEPGENLDVVLRNPINCCEDYLFEKYVTGVLQTVYQGKRRPIGSWITELGVMRLLQRVPLMRFQEIISMFKEFGFPVQGQLRYFVKGLTLALQTGVDVKFVLDSVNCNHVWKPVGILVNGTYMSHKLRVVDEFLERQILSSVMDLLVGSELCVYAYLVKASSEGSNMNLRTTKMNRQLELSTHGPAVEGVRRFKALLLRILVKRPRGVRPKQDWWRFLQKLIILNHVPDDEARTRKQEYKVSAFPHQIERFLPIHLEDKVYFSRASSNRCGWLVFDRGKKNRILGYVMSIVI